VLSVCICHGTLLKFIWSVFAKRRKSSSSSSNAKKGEKIKVNSFFHSFKNKKKLEREIEIALKNQQQIWKWLHFSHSGEFYSGINDAHPSHTLEFQFISISFQLSSSSSREKLHQLLNDAAVNSKPSRRVLARSLTRFLNVWTVNKINRL
jgi:hypothetical protein